MNVKARNLIVAAGALLLVAGVALAQSESVVDQVMRLSGFDAQIELDSHELALEVDRTISRMQIVSRRAQLLKDGVRRTHSAAALQHNVRAFLARDAAHEDLAAALTWLSSPVAQKITELEIAASRPERRHEVASTAGIISRSMTEKRRALIKELDESIGLTRHHVDSIINQRAVLQYASGSRTGQSLVPPSLDEVMKRVSADRESLLAREAENVFGRLSYAYLELSDEELRAYTEFAKSEVGRRYHDAQIKALRSTLLRAASELGAYVGR